MTYKIQRSNQGNKVLFALSGEINAAHVAVLQELVDREASHCVRLDLREITLADRDAIRFLARTQAAGAELLNCPEYVRRWIAAEPPDGTETSES